MKKRIFIVDDEPDFTQMLRLTLEAEGYYEVGEENDAAQAAASARLFDPDLIVLDIMMPEIEGSELAANFRRDSVLRDVPVVFMTALVSGTDAPAGTCSSGGHTFLPKDIALPKLIECIEDKLAKAAEAVPG